MTPDHSTVQDVPTDEGYFPALVRFLRDVAGRITPAGELRLTAEEAASIRSFGFPAAEGLWTIPRVSPILLKPHPSLAPLAEFWYAPRSYAVPSATSFANRPLAAPAQQLANPSRLRVWLRLQATADQRRILRVLAWHPEDRLQKRKLQQRLHRLLAVRLNKALRGLSDAGLVVRDGPWLVTSAEIRRALIQAGIGVSRRFRARAVADRTVKKRTRPLKRRWYEGRDGCMHYQPAFAHGRPTLAPVGTSTWGRQMLAKRGGLARQRQCRARGINPTAQATAARLARRGVPPRTTPMPVVHSSVAVQPSPAQPTLGRYRQRAATGSLGGQDRQRAPRQPALDAPPDIVPLAENQPGIRRRDASDVYCPRLGETRFSQALAELRKHGGSRRLW